MLAGNDRAAARHFLAHEFRRHEFRDLGAEALAVGEAFGRAFDRPFARQILAMGDIDHLLGDDPGAGEFELGDELARPAGAQCPRRRAERREMIGRDVAVVLRLDRAPLDRGIAARGDPGFAHRRQTGREIDRRRAFGIGAGRVIDPDRRLVRVAERDLAERHADVGTALGRGVDLARAADRPGGDGLRRGEFGNLVHGRLLSEWESGGENERRKSRMAAATSLRRHDPDQVQRVRRLAVSAPLWDAPRASWNLGLAALSVNPAIASNPFELPAAFDID